MLLDILCTWLDRQDYLLDLHDFVQENVVHHNLMYIFKINERSIFIHGYHYSIINNSISCIFRVTQIRNTKWPNFQNSPLCRLYPIVDLIDNVGLRVGGPISACLCHDAGYRHLVLNRIVILKHHPNHASAQMPCNVAMQRPDTWVVLEVLDDDVGVSFEHLHVTALRVVGIDNCSVPAVSG